MKTIQLKVATIAAVLMGLMAFGEGYVTQFILPDGSVKTVKDAEARLSIQVIQDSLTNSVNGATYDSEHKKILFKHDATTVAEIDATDFIKDGMVSSVTIANTNLVVTFNTDAGLEPIYIPIADIFDPNNYYDIGTANNTFVAKESGKGLSSNDFTSENKTKLDGIASGAEVNVQSDWNQTNTSADDFIKNKPAVFNVNSTETPSEGAVASAVSVKKAIKDVYDAADASLTAISNQFENIDTSDAIKGELYDRAIAQGNTFVSADGINQNVAVAIGDEAKAAMPEAVVNASSNKTLRSVSVAIGAHADATVSSGANSQGIAIGYYAQAKANNAIAIGAGMQHTNETITTGNATVATGSTSVAIGYDAKAFADGVIAIGKSAKATAANAVQLGAGTNSDANTLKFQNVTIVKDGKIYGALDTNEVVKAVSDSLDPQILLEEQENVTVRSHGMLTIAPTNSLNAGSEIGLTPTGTRNYEVFVANTEETRAGLPLNFASEIPGPVTLLGPWWTNKVMRLPVKIRMQEPMQGVVIVEVEQYNDGYAWNTSISSAILTNGQVVVHGTNLHFATHYAVGVHEAGDEFAKYPITNPLYATLYLPTNGVDYTATSEYPDIVWRTLYLYDKDGKEIAKTQITRFVGATWRWLTPPGIEIPFKIEDPVWDANASTWVLPQDIPLSLLQSPTEDAESLLWQVTEDIEGISGNSVLSITGSSMGM